MPTGPLIGAKMCSFAPRSGLVSMKLPTYSYVPFNAHIVYVADAVLGYGVGQWVVGNYDFWQLDSNVQTTRSPD